MSDLTLNPCSAATAPAGDKPLAASRLPAVPVRSKSEGRMRRRLGAIRLTTSSDDGFHLFRIY